MLNASNLAFVTFARMHGNLDGQVFAFFTMVVAAAEVVVGLAIIMTIFRSRRSVPSTTPTSSRTDGSPMTHILEKVTLPDDTPIGGAA